jgi:adenylyltransferase/sulfurtransferase
MNTRIHIPTPLRSYAGNRHEVEVEATDVVEALNALVEAHPGLRDHLFADDGRLR